ncbi:MAG: hypothetical protein HYW38_00060 [Candidatus Colwellbacteria bacterium]|nr:hypothetical protein [Candidatus Colwellbacteria bacterium]
MLGGASKDLVAQHLTVYGKQNNFTPAVKFSSPSALWLRLRRKPSPESLRDVPYDSNLLGSKITLTASHIQASLTSSSCIASSLGGENEMWM